MNFDQCATVLVLVLATVADMGSLVMSIGREWSCVGAGLRGERGIMGYELEIRKIVKKGVLLGHMRSLPRESSRAGTVLLKVRTAPEGGRGTGLCWECVQHLQVSCWPFWGSESLRTMI